MVGNHHITVLCRTLKVSRASYYRRKNHVPTAQELECTDLEKRITRIFHNEGKVTYDAIRIHHMLKKERVYQQSLYGSFEEAKHDVFDYIHRFYNRKRKHSAISYLTLYEMEEHALRSA